MKKIIIGIVIILGLVASLYIIDYTVNKGSCCSCCKRNDPCPNMGCCRCHGFFNKK